MVTPELLEFIRAQHKEGISREDLEGLLVSEGGWTKEDIAEGYATVLNNEAPQVVSPVDVVAREQAQVVVEALPVIPVLNILHEDVAPNPIKEPEPMVTTSSLTDGESPEVFRRPTIEIVEKPKVLEIVVPPPLPATPVEADDFLGIFNEEAVTPAVELAMQPEEKVPESSAALQSLVTPEIVKEKMVVPEATPLEEPTIAKIETSAVSSMPADATNAKVTNVAPSAIDMPSVPVSSAKPSTRSLGDLLAGNNQQTPSSVSVSSPVLEVHTPPVLAPQVSAASTFKFDLSKIRPSSTEIPVAGGQMHPDAGETPAMRNATEVVSRSGATPGPASWLTGQNNISTEKSSVPSVGSDVPKVQTTEKPSNVTDTTKSPIYARRSMASDLLLRGMGTTIPGMPAINPAPESELPLPVKKEAEKSTEQLSTETALAEDIKQKNAVKRTLAVVIGVVVSLIILAIAIFVFFKFGGPSALQTSTTAFSQFFDVTSFAYKGKGNIDLILSTATDGIPRTGVAKFNIDYAGSLLNDKEGYGDGLHRTKFSGELSSGDFTWKTDTDIETDIRMIGSSLYFRVLSFPDTSNLDPELFKTYWVKINLSKIAKELALSGVTLSQEQDGYGSFGGQSSETTFNALMKKHTPFPVITNLPDEQLNGVDVYHSKMQADPDKMLAFASALYRKYVGKELLLTSDQRIRFMNALAKIEGESWVDKKTGTLLQVSFTGNFDDDFVDVHVKGPINLQFALNNFNKQISTETPTPILTLEELKVRMEDYKKVADARQRDQGKVERMNTITSALDAYNSAKGRFPVLLTELYSAGVLASSTVEEVKLKAYNYAAYIDDVNFTKTNRCTAKGKVCAYYHIGVNLEDTENPLLQNDADGTSDVRGVDGAGCAGEQGLACYDSVTIVMGNQ